ELSSAEPGRQVTRRSAQIAIHRAPQGLRRLQEGAAKYRALQRAEAKEARVAERGEVPRRAKSAERRARRRERVRRTERSQPPGRQAGLLLQRSAGHHDR